MKRGQSGDLINTVSPDIPESSDPWRSCGERLLQACHEKGSDVGSSPTGSARSDVLKSMVFSISRQLADRLRWLGSFGLTHAQEASSAKISAKTSKYCVSDLLIAAVELPVSLKQLRELVFVFTAA